MFFGLIRMFEEVTVEKLVLGLFATTPPQVLNRVNVKSVNEQYFPQLSLISFIASLRSRVV